MDNTDNKIVPVHPGKTLQDFLKQSEQADIYSKFYK
jgi:hypothetical protein